MEGVPTAWEFITSHPGHLTGEVDDETIMIEFTRLHLQAVKELVRDNMWACEPTLVSVEDIDEYINNLK